MKVSLLILFIKLLFSDFLYIFFTGCTGYSHLFGEKSISFKKKKRGGRSEQEKIIRLTNERLEWRNPEAINLSAEVLCEKRCGLINLREKLIEFYCYINLSDM